MIRTGVLVNLGLVEVLDDVGDRLDRSVPSMSVRPAVREGGTHGTARYIHLEVSSDEELATHFGYWSLRFTEKIGFDVR